MEVILLENISNLGGLGDRVDVKAGFGRNFLIPQGKAVPATEDNIAQFEARRAELEAAAAEPCPPPRPAPRPSTAWAADYHRPPTPAKKASCSARWAPAISPRRLPLPACEVDKSEVRLPEGALRELGEYEIAIQVHGDVTAMVALARRPE